MAGQLLQPSFFYSAVLLTLGLGTAALLSKINSGAGGRWRSLAYVLPLAIPLLVLIAFPPSLYAGPFELLGASFVPGGDPVDGHLLMDPGSAQYLASDVIAPSLPLAPEVLSIGGIVLMIGLALFGASLLLSVLLGGWIARRTLGVIDMSPEDYPGTQRDLADLAASLGVSVPRIGLIEDLRPNAFTFGMGRRATVVLSVGLLELLSEEEVRAVMAHELAHIKNHDVLFKSVTRALALLSFYNPLSYMAVRAARRERERMADEMARSVLGGDDALVRAIEKVTDILSRDGKKSSFSVGIGLSLALSMADRSSLMSTHPSFTDRVRSMRHQNGPTLSRPACAALSIAVLLAAGLIFIGLGEVRAEILSSVMPSGFDHLSLGHQMIRGPFGAMDAGSLLDHGFAEQVYHRGSSATFVDDVSPL